MKYLWWVSRFRSRRGKIRVGLAAKARALFVVGRRTGTVMTHESTDPGASLAMVRCPYCEGPRRGVLRRLLRQLVGQPACVACGGYGDIPGSVHEAWTQGRCGAQEWAQYHAAHRSWCRGLHRG